MKSKWRRDRDSNSGRCCHLAGFQDQCFQPLSHLSVFVDFVILFNILKSKYKGYKNIRICKNLLSHTYVS